jgi:hypothetical protein
MSALAERPGETPTDVAIEIEISLAAITGYGRLLRAVGRMLVTHATADGGLICEYRASRARSILWRIRPDGEVLADTPYSHVRRDFVAVELPASV